MNTNKIKQQLKERKNENLQRSMAIVFFIELNELQNIGIQRTKKTRKLGE